MQFLVSSDIHLAGEAAALIVHRRAAVIPPGSSLLSSQQMMQTRILLESAQKQKFIQTQPQHSLSSPSKNFHGLEGRDSCWDTAMAVGGSWARWGGSSVPSSGPSLPVAPLLSVIVLTEVEG